jgi:uncharacterized protein (DUF885 family)
MHTAEITHREDELMSHTAGNPMSEIYAIADRYVDKYAALDPCSATNLGVTGHDHEMTDYSPTAIAARTQLLHDTRAELNRTAETNDNDRLAKSVMIERFESQAALEEAGEELRQLSVIGSPVQSIRQCFDLMAYDTDADWQTVTERITHVPDALASLEATLREGVARGIVAAQRQALACAEQCATWGGKRDAEPFFGALAARRPNDAALERAAGAATEAYARLGAYLTEEYAPVASPRDPAGIDRYRLFSRAFNGIDLDFDETYAWGWDELYRIEDRMRTLAEVIKPGAGIAEAIDYLDSDPSAPAIEGVDEFRAWNQDWIDRTISELNGTHFDIAAPLQTCQAMIAPPGGAAAMYYTPPTEDFSRPGRTWYPTLGATRFPLWNEVSTCYHEAVPGHHLQVAQVVYLSEKLTRYQRMFGFVSGHGEGWALYAERLMGELGYLEDPAYEMGMLGAQAMRAVRVIVDIGMHLEMPSPEHDGAVWNAEMALPFVVERSRFPEAFMRSEVDRYLGWPAQAISYKVGERVWLECREDAMRRHGADFNLKAFHTYALDIGSMGLRTLREELARF